MEKNIPELYGSLVFNDRIMRNKLPKDMYKALRKNHPERHASGTGCCQFCSCCNERMGH